MSTEKYAKFISEQYKKASASTSLYGTITEDTEAKDRRENWNYASGNHTDDFTKVSNDLYQGGDRGGYNYVGKHGSHHSNTWIKNRKSSHEDILKQVKDQNAHLSSKALAKLASDIHQHLSKLD